LLNKLAQDIVHIVPTKILEIPPSHSQYHLIYKLNWISLNVIFDKYPEKPRDIVLGKNS